MNDTADEGSPTEVTRNTSNTKHNTHPKNDPTRNHAGRRRVCVCERVRECVCCICTHSSMLSKLTDQQKIDMVRGRHDGCHQEHGRSKNITDSKFPTRLLPPSKKSVQIVVRDPSTGPRSLLSPVREVGSLMARDN